MSRVRLHKSVADVLRTGPASIRHWAITLAAAVAIAGPLTIALRAGERPSTGGDRQPNAADRPLSAAEGELFESQIRPVLVERCYDCHSTATKTEGSLALDWRDGLLKGGDSGPAIVPGKPGHSLLISAIRHATEELRMPQDGPKLSGAVVRAFERWIEMGAPDPRRDPPSADDIRRQISWESVRDRRKQWWSFLPIVDAAPPAPRDGSWSSHPVDCFLLARQEAAGLSPAANADRATLLRRLTYALTGLPPTLAELDAFLADSSAGAYESAVDRLLASPRFGEHWARHWMDLFRYAESHGSEGDPPIPFAWRYRDYLIRAFNADVPYDQLIREHFAGDLLNQPRWNAELGINESALGIGHFRMVLHGYAPTDALDEQVTFTDNQVDVVGKAVLGLTISCARCHNHKFDAISQADFYALYGVMASCRPALITVDQPARLAVNRVSLVQLKAELRAKLADAWLAAIDKLPEQLEQAPQAESKPATKPPKEKKKDGDVPPRVDLPDLAARWQAAINEAAASDGRSPLAAWTTLRSLDGERFADEWRRQLGKSDERQAQNARARQAAISVDWRLAGDDHAAWFESGSGLGSKPSPPGEFHIYPSGPQIIANIYPAGVYTHLVSDKHNGVLTSPRFKIDCDEIYFRVLGDNDARARFVVRNYPRAAGPIYPFRSLSRSDAPEWHSLPTTYWRGDVAYLEIATSEDLPVEARDHGGRSWFGAIEALGVRADGPRPVEVGAPLVAVATGAPPETRAALAERYAQTLRTIVRAWRDAPTSNAPTSDANGPSPNLTDLQAEFLGFFVRRQLLPNRLEDLPDVVPLVERYRALEEAIPVPTRAPGVLEADSADQCLFVRGNPKQPGEAVERRFLEAFDATPYHPRGSGRRELAESLVARDNPLVARVAVNRLWHYVFGAGIVTTVDNFGALGERPTHPELLDYLATRFVREGWSIKRMLRLMVTSRAFQTSCQARPGSESIDPENKLLAHFSIRRLEAEAIRDSLLAAPGRLDLTMFGPSDGGRSRRRSVYVTIRRNSPEPLLEVFDAPKTASPQGRRDATNVPAQPLALLNDPFVADLARRWSEAVIADPELREPARRVERMFRQATGRLPTDNESRELLAYVRDLAAEFHLGEADVPGSERVWQDVAHGLFNLKEFIFLD